MADDRIPRRTLAGLLFGSLAVFSGLAGALRMLFRTPDRDTREVILAAQGVLRQRLPQGVDVRFAPVKDTRTEPKGNDLYVVTGWLEIRTQQGEQATFDYSCVMLLLAGGQWVSEKVEIVPRP
jgi:hypothetical protein